MLPSFLLQRKQADTGYM